MSRDRLRSLFVALLTLGLAARPASAQVEPAGCDCGALLEALIEKVETNHPGFRLEVVGTDLEPGYRSTVTDLRARAAATGSGLPCTRVLQDYVATLRDGHLFVGRSSRLSAEDSLRLEAGAPRVATTEAEARAHLEAKGRDRDPAEGIWRDPAGLTLAVVHASVTGAPPSAGDSLVAFVLASTAEAWEPGDVRGSLVPLPDGSYEAVLRDAVGVASRPHVFDREAVGGGRLKRDGLLLHMPPTTWGRLHPTPPAHVGRIDPVDPRAPTARLETPGVVVFHVPSNLPSHAARLRALVEQYRAATERADLMILDLRGNEGGSAFVTDVFLPFLATPDREPPRYLAEGEMAVLSTPDNVARFEGLSWAPPGLVERLRAHPGELVPFADPETAEDLDAGAAPEEPVDVEMPRPRRVAIVIDRGTVSAAEAFVLKAMRYGKVTLYGQPTGASIDYQTVGIVRFGCRESGYYVGYPTIVGSDRLPEGGTRPTGIVPDVPIDFEERDPIAWIVGRSAVFGDTP